MNILLVTYAPQLVNSLLPLEQSIGITYNKMLKHMVWIEALLSTNEA